MLSEFLILKVVPLLRAAKPGAGGIPAVSTVPAGAASSQSQAAEPAIRFSAFGPDLAVASSLHWVTVTAQKPPSLV